MKRNIGTVLGLVMIGFLLIFCNACGVNEAQSADVNNLSAKKNFTNVVTAFSMDEYDGFLDEGYGGREVRFDDQPRDSASHSSFSHTTAFFTFVEPANLALAQKAKLEIFVTDFWDSCSESQGQDPHLYLFVKPWLVDEKDIVKWQNCKYSRFGVNGSFYEPEGCEIIPHQYWPMIGFEMRHESGEPNKGWYVIDSARLLDVIKTLPIRLLDDKRYFSFEIEISVLGNLVPCLGHPSFEVSFEDGGNHGGTGNLPTLEIIY